MSIEVCEVKGGCADFNPFPVVLKGSGSIGPSNQPVLPFRECPQCGPIECGARMTCEPGRFAEGRKEGTGGASANPPSILRARIFVTLAEGNFSIADHKAELVYVAGS